MFSRMGHLWFIVIILSYDSVIQVIHAQGVSTHEGSHSQIPSEHRRFLGQSRGSHPNAVSTIHYSHTISTASNNFATANHGHGGNNLGHTIQPFSQYGQSRGSGNYNAYSPSTSPSHSLIQAALSSHGYTQSGHAAQTH